MQGNSVPGAYAAGGPEELGRGAALRIESDSQFVQGIPNVSQTRTPDTNTRRTRTLSASFLQHMLELGMVLARWREESAETYDRR